MTDVHKVLRRSPAGNSRGACAPGCLRSCFRVVGSLMARETVRSWKMSGLATGGSPQSATYRSAAHCDESMSRGLVVTPGFIDVHNHADEDVVHAEYRAAPAMIHQGVTRRFGGSTAVSTCSAFRTLKSQLGQTGVGVNYMLYIGHNGLRVKEWGWRIERPLMRNSPHEGAFTRPWTKERWVFRPVSCTYPVLRQHR